MGQQVNRPAPPAEQWVHGQGSADHRPASSTGWSESALGPKRSWLWVEHLRAPLCVSVCVFARAHVCPCHAQLRSANCHLSCGKEIPGQLSPRSVSTCDVLCMPCTVTCPHAAHAVHGHVPTCHACRALSHASVPCMQLAQLRSLPGNRSQQQHLMPHTAGRTGLCLQPTRLGQAAAD